MVQLFQVIGGGLLLSFLIYWKGRETYEVISEVLCGRRGKEWLPFVKSIIALIVSIFVASIMIEPMITGNATINVIAPEKKRIPTLLENLRVRVTPTGLLGDSAGKSERISKFDVTGFSVINVRLGMFQSRVNLAVYDVTSPSSFVVKRSVFINPFVRRQLSSTMVDLTH